MDIRAHIQIDAPADQAWSIIGEQFGHIGDWAAGIRASSLDGVPAAGRIRTCHIDGGGATRVLQERLLTFDTAGRSLSYQVVAGMPGFVRSAVNQWQVRATTPGTCVVSIHARFTLTPVTWPLLPPFRWSTRRTMAGILDQLRYRVENGTAHPDKTTTRLPTVASSLPLRPPPPITTYGMSTTAASTRIGHPGGRPDGGDPAVLHPGQLDRPLHRRERRLAGPQMPAYQHYDRQPDQHADPAGTGLGKTPHRGRRPDKIDDDGHMSVLRHHRRRHTRTPGVRR